MKKQYCFCRTALLLCAWLFSSAVWAFEVDGIYYNILSSDDKTVAVTESPNYSYSGDVTIPATVTHNGTEYRVTAIGMFAFYNCTGLTSVTIGNGVTTIDNAVFYNCTSITSITIPESVTSINYNAFGNCTGLKEVHISDLDAWWHIKFNSNPLYYAHNLYLNDNPVTELSVPADITTIDNRFQNCTSIMSITIPNSVTSIGYYAFSGCTGLTSVTIPESVTTISDEAFYDCKNLTSVTIPESIQTIGERAFSGCTSLEKFEGKWASSDQRCLIENRSGSGDKVLLSFAPSGLSSYTIPESITRINDYAFSGCTGLTSITIPESVTSIGEGAFYGCTGLTSVTIPNSVPYISSEAFKGCTGLTSITIPNSVTSISDYAFSGCMNLKNLRIEDGTEELTLRLGYASGYKSPFDDCPLDTIYLGRNISSSLFTTEHPDHEYIPFENNKKSIVSLTIGNQITSIREEAFLNWTGLTSVTIPNSVTTIGRDAFYGCTALDTLELPYVKDIGYSNSSNRDNIGIYTCTGLKKLDIGSAEYLPAGFLSNLTQLEDLTIPYIGAGSKNEATGKNGLLGALFGTKSVSGMKAVEQYYNETKAITSYLPTGLRKLTITDGCEELPYGALYNVSTLREVVLPASLYMVGEKAFYGCAGIEHLYCRGAAPAGCYENSFTGMRLATCVLHVPHNSVELYQRSDGWKNFYFIQGEEPIRIDVVKNIAHAGIVTGLTEYALYDEALLTAIAHSGYRFVSWMEDGSEICTQESYRFRAESNRNLTAVFMPVFNENDVEITPSAHTASLSWETEEGVDEYSLTLYSDAVMTDTVQTIRLDIAAQKVRATAMSSIEVENLDAETEYYYVLTGISADGTIASQKTGSFKTTESASDALKETQQADGHVTVYNLQGVLVLETDDAAALKTLQNGAYIVNGKKMIIVR